MALSLRRLTIRFDLHTSSTRRYAFGFPSGITRAPLDPHTSCNMEWWNPNSSEAICRLVFDKLPSLESTALWINLDDDPNARAVQMKRTASGEGSIYTTDQIHPQEIFD